MISRGPFRIQVRVNGQWVDAPVESKYSSLDEARRAVSRGVLWYDDSRFDDHDVRILNDHGERV